VIRREVIYKLLGQRRNGYLADRIYYDNISDKDFDDRENVLYLYCFMI
jgi:hypothetical protein